MAGAEEFESVAEAVADCSLVAGTTAVGPRRREHPVITLAEAGVHLRGDLLSGHQGRVALLFGSEKTGLSNEELSHCNWLVTIPMHQTPGVRHPSMNLGQAVAVCLYEMVRESGLSLPQEPLEPALAGDLERLTALLNQIMEESGYARRHPANFDQIRIRRLIRSMALDRSHTLAWTGILRQILWKFGNDPQAVEPSD
nr:TrmH family RNA methyltransferase [Acidisarcina polymorpha]